MDYSNIVEKVITFIICLILSLFLMTVISNAETLNNGQYDFSLADNVLQIYQSKPEYTSGDYYSICFLFNNNYEMYFIPKADNPNFKFKFQGNSNYITNGKYTRASVGCNQTMYNLHFYGGINANLSTLSSYNWRWYRCLLSSK